jgi:hypothetical protein
MQNRFTGMNFFSKDSSHLTFSKSLALCRLGQEFHYRNPSFGCFNELHKFILCKDLSVTSQSIFQKNL